MQRNNSNAPLKLSSEARSSTTQANLSAILSTINRELFRQIITAQLSGSAALPHGLGLDNTTYNELLSIINSPYLNKQEANWQCSEQTPSHERAAVYGELLDIKAEERNELVTLLLDHSNEKELCAMQMAVVIATACLAQFHLWHSLGLSDRSQLGTLLKHNFPALHDQNNKNMRWKRFFYRCLCERGGDYLCRSPNCSACSSYATCFV
ncbi:nitrogen fixation protein NifQ [Psychromonas antarctica]|uniref:nitrogen fixation protein NifQ n=1 Tax=Psychromonas antarctica TaxID=67573 RepID=UPI001EE9306D|nr:nitrogen fixation protein NifQ [Psychromonas antarctica]MCG6200833.1 nitrogen fixation protein NifQ [Psychromonas antarctica]